MATQTASSSSSSWKYDVFLSFCGDTRMNFTDHLYTTLKQKGIFTFKDDKNLKQGKCISSELLKAIEESKYAIIVLSTNYAFSRWCLNELVKIVECKKKIGLIVLPVFYHVEPSDVRNQTRTLVEAFAKHEKDPKVNTEDVQVWKSALKEVGNISGWQINNRHESLVIQQILKMIFSQLNCKFSSTVSKDLVGIDSCVKEVLDLYLDEGLGGVRFIGICGMGGMGKTTLAQEIYKRISNNFEASSFIDNVREEARNHRLVSLQKQLLSKILMESEINVWTSFENTNIIGNRLCNKNVLIVLDDVDEEEQLESLAGNHDWFGEGSRIIVTSRDNHLLRRHGINFIYTVKGLNDNDALQLFSWRAFKKSHPEENYMDLSKEFVNYANGLPLALKVLGSLLFDKDIDEWKSSLGKLKAEPNRKILDILQISFDGLMATQKELFLDIACFFKGEKNDCLRDILKSFGYYPDYNIGVLIDKSLITIKEQGILWMHDLLQEMGQEIVHRESPKEPGRRSRLWLHKDVLYVLKNNTGTEKVEGIMLNMPIETEEQLSSKAFSKMKKLRLLKINNVQPPQDFIRGSVQLPQGLSYLSNELHAIDWHGYPLKSMPIHFQPNKLVELRMHCSSIKILWNEIIILNELKLIDLSDSQNLIEIPNLSGVPNLKQLILRGCSRLYKIHASLGNLKQLNRLDLNGCKCLESLPHKISLEALEIFDLGGCSRLKKFPEIVGNMSRLSELYLNETSMKDISLLLEHLTGLSKLDLRDCKNLSSLPDVICSLMSLKTLILSHCSKLDKLPENLGNVEGLEELDVSGTALRGLPSSIVLLKNLKKLFLRGCDFLSSTPSNKLLNFPLLQRRSPNPMGMLERSLSCLCSLTDLDLSFCNLQAIPDIFDCLSSITHLYLRGNNFVYLPKNIVQLSKLDVLYLSGCTNLRMFPKLPLNIKHIVAASCTSLETLSIRPEDEFHPQIYLVNCGKLTDNQGYDDIFLTMLRRHIQRPVLGYVDIIIPGREIPKWFSHQNEGTSVNLQGPSNFMGISLCVIFILSQHHPIHQPLSENFDKYTHSINFEYNVIGSAIKDVVGITFSEQYGKIDSFHLWLKYVHLKGRWDEELSQIDANGFSQIDIRILTKGPNLEVMKCGARLVYEQDIEYLKQNMAGSSSCSITPYEDDSDYSAKDTQIKRSHDDYDGNMAEPSEKCSFNEVEVPHPKWIEHPNLIENWIGNLCTKGEGNYNCEEDEFQ